MNAKMCYTIEGCQGGANVRSPDTVRNCVCNSACNRKMVENGIIWWIVKMKDEHNSPPSTVQHSRPARQARPDPVGRDGPAARDLSRHGPGHVWLMVGSTLLMLGLISFAIYQCARHLTTDLNTLRTQEVIDTIYTDLELYLFRDETVVGTGDGNLFLYGVQDGEKVAAGKKICDAYVTLDGDTVGVLQTQLDMYSDRIRSLESGSGGSTSSVTAALTQAEAHYRAALMASAAGDIRGTFQYGGDLLAALEAYRGLSGNGETASGLETARREQEALVAGLQYAGMVTTERAGWFSRSTDGLEGLFTVERANNMTVEDLRTLAAYADSDREPVATYGVAGRMIYSSLYYAAACLPTEDAAPFKVGEDYRAICGDAAGSELILTCIRRETDGEDTLLVFSTQDHPDRLTDVRSILVEAVLEETSGYRVPTGAIVTLSSPATGEPVSGVYILSGNRIEFRRILVRAERDGYVIAQTVEEVQSALEDADADATWIEAVEADGWSFLRLNDRMVTGGRNLYEGKVIS